jgi:hypothetical protein
VADCITAQITANRKALLKTISIAGGDSFTPALVEEQRLKLTIGDNDPYIQLLLGEVTPETENNDTEQTNLDYFVMFFANYNDDTPGSEEITYKFRNVVADITKKWMSDRTCGGIAEGTKRITYDCGTVIPDNKGDLFFVVSIHFQVQLRIDSSDPFQI